MIEVNTDLMRSTRLGLQSDSSNAFKALDDIVARFGIATLWVIAANRHLVALIRMGANGLADYITIQFQFADHLRKVFLLHMALFKLLGQFHVNRVALSY